MDQLVHGPNTGQSWDSEDSNDSNVERNNSLQRWTSKLSSHPSLIRRMTSSLSSIPSLDEQEGSLYYSNCVEHIGFGKFQYILLGICGLIWTAESMEMMLISFLMWFLADEWSISPSTESMLGSITFAGILVGSVFWGSLSDRIGRKKAIFYVTLITSTFGFLSAFSINLWMLLAIRFVVGLGIGGVIISFTLFAEFVPVALRGKTLLIVEGGFWAVGAMIVSLVAWAVLPTLGWRWFLALSSTPGFVALALFAFIPESPRFYMVSGQPQKAEQVFRYAAELNQRPLPDGFSLVDQDEDLPGSPEFESKAQDGDSVRPSHQFHERSSRLQSQSTLHQEDPHEMGHATPYENKHRGQFSELFAPHLKKTTLLIWFLWSMNMLIYYGIVLLTPRLFEQNSDNAISSGPAEVSSQQGKNGDISVYLGSLLTSFAELPGLLVTVLLIDRIGRRRCQVALFFAGFIFMSLLAVSVFLDEQRGGEVSKYSISMWTTIFSILSRTSISSGFNALYVYTNEVYPTYIRSTGMGTASSVSRIIGMITPFISNYLGKVNVLIPLVMFAVGCLLASIVSHLLPIETAGIDLYDE